MSVEIFCLSHKDFTPPEDNIYIPLSVFCESGFNIAEKNKYYSELTGCYWAWKNSDADVKGICHYRRYLLNEGGVLLNEKQIHLALAEYDMIVPKVLELNFPYEYGFSKNHKPYYLNELEKLLFEKYPEEYKVYKRLSKGVNTLFGNMLICKRELFDDYHAWLFKILFELESRIVIEEEDAYHRRIFGFISEFLLYVYIVMRNLKCKHVMVGMVGEKVEVRALKERLSEYFARKDWQGARDLFLEERAKRPDLLMEASDIGWELHYCMEAIAIAGYESDAGGVKIFDDYVDLQGLISKLRELNRTVKSQPSGCVCVPGFSPEAVAVAGQLVIVKLHNI